MGKMTFYIYGSGGISGYGYYMQRLADNEDPEKTCKENGWTFRGVFENERAARKKCNQLNVQEILDP
jgi:hypothetical protein